MSGRTPVVLDLLGFLVHSTCMTTVRIPAVAGTFYPAEEAALRQAVESYLQEADAATLEVKALVVPHAGYIYSGPIAASAYKTVLGSFEPTRVVLLGPAHRVAVRGMALPSAARFATPLGDIPIDLDAVGKLKDLSAIEISDEAHAQEHSLEVQLPFLQVAFTNFQLVPLVVGGASAQEIHEVLAAVVDEQTLIVVSSDLSHYLPYEVARQVDRQTTDAILSGNERLLVGERACGAHPLRGLMHYAKEQGWQPQLLDLRTSGDTAGPKDEVVGYGAFAYHV
jgi:AmmeMemoRadiSam system protein B